MLFRSFSNPESLKVILECYPKNQRLDAVKEPNFNRGTVLHEAILYPESVKTILELLPENQRLEAVKAKGFDRFTTLDIAVTNKPESFEIILGLLPENQRLDAVIDSDVLTILLSNPTLLTAILETFPIPKECPHALRKELLTELLELKKKNQISDVEKISTLTKFFHLSDVKKISSLTKFFQGAELNEEEITTLKSGNIGRIFSNYLSSEAMERILPNSASKKFTPFR